MPDLSLIQSPFERLRRLLGDAEPGDEPIDLTIGEPRHDMPDFLMARLGEASDTFKKYPPIRGTAELRAALGAWHLRRYGIEIDAEREVIPLNGSREGLFLATFSALERRPAVARPAVLMPDPFYQVYAAGALAAGAEPVFMPARLGSGFLPDLSALVGQPDLLERAVAMFVCSPSNPQGAVADRAYLAEAIGLARHHDFMLFADECYSEVYPDTPPPGALQVARGDGEDGALDNVVAFNSLSKRSNLAGLRSGFAAGDAAFLDRFTQFRNVSAPQVALPIQHASAHVWADEAHVEASRRLYAQKFDIADSVLAGRFDHVRPGGGFFLWLNMGRFGGGEQVAVTLWKRCGVKVLPGAFLSRARVAADDPGHDYVRVALVHDPATTRKALERMVQLIG